MKNRDLILYRIRLSEVKAIHIHHPTKLPDGVPVRNVMWRILPWLSAVPHQQGAGQPASVGTGGAECPAMLGGGRGVPAGCASLCPCALPPVPAFPILRGFGSAEWQQPVCFECVIGSEIASGVPRVLEVP